MAHVFALRMIVEMFISDRDKIRKILNLPLILILGCLSTFSVFSNTSVAFFYNTNPPVNIFGLYNVVVVQPYAHVDSILYKRNKNSKLYAYVSLGELNKDSELIKQIDQKWIIADNPVWNSLVMNADNPNWRKFFIDHEVTPLVKRGFQGIFLDTADSYLLGVKSETEKKAQELGLIKIIKNIHEKFPNLKLLINRGFDLIPSIHSIISGVVAESLYFGWNEREKKYIKFSDEYNNYLITELRSIKNKYHLPIIVISYLPEDNKQKYLALAKKIAALGFSPWITNHTLTTDGVYDRVIKPREIMLVDYDDSKEDPYGESSNGFNYLAMPIEYLGYIPLLKNIKNPLTVDEKNRAWAGIVVFKDTISENYSKEFLDWLVQEKRKGVPIIFFNGFPFKNNSKYAKTFDVEPIKDADQLGKLKLSKNSTHVNYELSPEPLASVPEETINTENTWLSLKTSSGHLIPVIGKTPWGGFLMSGYGYWLHDEKTMWIVNPFDALKDMLRLTPIPALDVTTENGDRLMMIHIDGDAFISKAQFNSDEYTAQIIQKHILDFYKLPTTVSIVEGEIGKAGLYPELSDQAQKIARDIFKPNYIELASHSYSHPFDWLKIEGFKQKSLQNMYNLPIKGYTFNIKRDIEGSVDYINQVLAPTGKKVKVFLWTGYANPSEDAVKLTYKIGVMNMNGGGASVTQLSPSITSIPPLGIYKGNYFQVYAPIANEIPYTDIWRGPFYGFQNVIQTFKLTNSPIRFKPIDIYYHFYSGEKLASLAALKRIYDWTEKQKLMHVFVSEYTKKVLGFNRGVYSKINHGYLIHTSGIVRELRIDKSQGYPDFTNSENIIGFNEYNNVRYIHLGTSNNTKLIFSDHYPQHLFLQSANNKVTSWKNTHNYHDFDISFTGFDPLVAHFENTKHCYYQLDSKKAVEVGQSSLIIKSEKAGKHELKIRCEK